MSEGPSGPKATELEFRRFVLAKLETLSDGLVGVLRQLIAEKFPPEVKLLHFEIFTDGFTSGFPARVFFMDANYNEKFVVVNGKYEYPTTIDPGLLQVESVYTDEEVARFAENEELDPFTVAGSTLVPWFRECWRQAGGTSFDRLATIGLHDDPPVRL